MNSKFFSFLSAGIISIALLSCSGGKQLSPTPLRADSVKTVANPLRKFKYRFHLSTPQSLSLHHDEIWIDTTGQMTFATDQKL